MVGREDGGREVVAVDEDLSNFAKSEAPMCGMTQPQPNKCKQWATFQVLAVFPTTTPSTTYLVSTIIAFTSTTTDFVSGSYSTSPSHLCLISAVLISVLLHFLDPSPPSPVAPFPFDGSPITTCSPQF